MSEYCKYCGTSTCDARTLLNGWCPKHPSGPSRGKHGPAWCLLPRKFARAEGIELPDEYNEEPCEARSQEAERPPRTLWRPGGIKRTKT